MKANRIKIVFTLLVTIFGTMAAFAQDDVFSDPNVEYSFIVPGDRWKMTAKPSATNPNVEYVYGDRRVGLFSVRKVSIAKDSIMSEVIQSEGIDKLQFSPGFVAGKQEQFAGKLQGTVFNYEYLAAGKAMSGRYYFMRANPTTVYILRFQGDKDTLRTIRNETDSFARTFYIKS